jgi:hypothetical protein
MKLYSDLLRQLSICRFYGWFWFFSVIGSSIVCAAYYNRGDYITVGLYAFLGFCWLLNLIIVSQEQTITCEAIVNHSEFDVMKLPPLTSWVLLRHIKRKNSTLKFPG